MDLDRLTGTFDFRLDENGDLMLTKDHKGQIATVVGVDYLIQQIEIRLKESELEDLLGLENSQEVAEKAKEIIVRALTFDNLVAIDDVFVEAVPVSPFVLAFFVFVKSPNEAFQEQQGNVEEEDNDPIGFEVSLHLSHGAKLRRVM